MQLVAEGRLTPSTEDLDFKNLSPDQKNDILNKYRLYCDAKGAAKDFQLVNNYFHSPFRDNLSVLFATKKFQAKDRLFTAFKAAELGSWVKKPMEQDVFQIMDNF